MDNPRTKRCETCLHFQPGKEPQPEQNKTLELVNAVAKPKPIIMGNCKARPPTALLVQQMMPGNVASKGQAYLVNSPSSLFPPVPPFEWCGKWEGLTPSL